jgi:predicted nucleic acid-binding protein
MRNAIRDELVRAVVPGLWIYEVGNTIARRFPTHAGEWLAALAKFALEEAPVSPRWLTQALQLTRSCSVTFYDAAYHATALVNDGVFVTADVRYLQQAASHGGVVYLDDWNPPRNPRPQGRN